MAVDTHKSKHLLLTPTPSLFNPRPMPPMDFNFSPDGRLIQVEYAQHASTQGGIATIQAVNDTVRIAYENHHINSLLVPQPRIHCIDKERGFFMLFSGLKPDSLLLKREAIRICRQYKCNTTEDISIEELARKLGKYKQRYTVDPAYRPLGLRSVLFGIEEGKGRILVIEADGNCSEYDRCAVGYRNNQAMEYLNEHADEYALVRSLMEVAQNDPSKLAVYTLREKKLVRHEQEDVARML